MEESYERVRGGREMNSLLISTGIVVVINLLGFIYILRNLKEPKIQKQVQHRILITLNNEEEQK